MKQENEDKWTMFSVPGNYSAHRWQEDEQGFNSTSNGFTWYEKLLDVKVLIGLCFTHRVQSLEGQDEPGWGIQL